MNGKELYGMLNGLEERLIEETLQAEPVRRHIPFKMALSAAACLCLCVAVLAVAVITGPKQQTPSENGGGAAQSPQQSEAPSQIEDETAFSRLVVNDFSNVQKTDACKRYFDPALYTEQVWNWDQITAYFGKDMTPKWIPEELSGQSANRQMTAVIRNSDGAVVNDVFAQSYFTWYYDDGSQSPWGEAVGFTVAASKTGAPSDCVYIFDQEMEHSIYQDTEILLGYTSMGYDYNEQKQPMKTYDFWIAHFTYDSIQYEITASNLEQDVFLKIVASLF